MTQTTKHTATKTGDGEYVYRGRIIYRTTNQRGAYNPWKVSLGRSFATLAEAKAYIDSVSKE